MLLEIIEHLQWRQFRLASVLVPFGREDFPEWGRKPVFGPLQGVLIELTFRFVVRAHVSIYDAIIPRFDVFIKVDANFVTVPQPVRYGQPRVLFSELDKTF